MVDSINISIWFQPQLVLRVKISCLHTSYNYYCQKYHHLVASIDILIWSQPQLISTVNTNLPTNYNNDPSRSIDVWLTVPSFWSKVSPFGQKYHHSVKSITIRLRVLTFWFDHNLNWYQMLRRLCQLVIISNYHQKNRRLVDSITILIWSQPQLVSTVEMSMPTY